MARASETAAFRKAAGLIGTQPFEWRFAVVDKPEVNAFCLPGGKVVVYTGIIPACKTDAGLAVVLAHEISHALARHGAERMTQQGVADAGAKAAAVGLGRSGLGATTRDGLMRALNAGEKYGLLAYQSRPRVGGRSDGAAAHGRRRVRPGRGPGLLGPDADGPGGEGPVYASTHPAHATRIADPKRRQGGGRPPLPRHRSAVRPSVAPAVICGSAGRGNNPGLPEVRATSFALTASVSSALRPGPASRPSPATP